MVWLIRIAIIIKTSMLWKTKPLSKALHHSESVYYFILDENSIVINITLTTPLVSGFLKRNSLCYVQFFGNSHRCDFWWGQAPGHSQWIGCFPKSSSFTSSTRFVIFCEYVQVQGEFKDFFLKRVKWDQGSQKARYPVKPTTKTRCSYCFHLGISWDFRPSWLLTYKTSNEIDVLARGKLSFYRPMHRNMNHLKLYTFSIWFL